MAIPVEQITFTNVEGVKQVSWTLHEDEVPLVEALEQLSSVCEGYIPKKSTFPELEEQPEKGLTGHDQIVYLDMDGNLVAIVDLGVDQKYPTLDCINATSADFYALLDAIHKKKIVNLNKNKTIRILLKRVPK